MGPWMMIDGSLSLIFARIFFWVCNQNAPSAAKKKLFLFRLSQHFPSIFNIHTGIPGIAEHTYIYDDRHNYMNHKFKRIFATQSKKKTNNNKGDLCINYENTHWIVCIGLEIKSTQQFLFWVFINAQMMMPKPRYCNQ